MNGVHQRSRLHVRQCTLVQTPAIFFAGGVGGGGGGVHYSRAAAIYRDMRFIAIFFYISRYAIYRDTFLVISRYKRTWIYGDSRKNRRRKSEMNESHSADATSVGPYIRIQLRCCVYTCIYCKSSPR